MTESQKGPFYTRRDDPVALARREKTLALMSSPPRSRPEKARGHREWSLPMAERKARHG